MVEISVRVLKEALEFAGIKLTSGFVEQLFEDQEVMVAINEDFLDGLFKKLIGAGVLNPQLVSDQNLWETAKQYLLEQSEE